MSKVWTLLRDWADKRPGGMTDSQIARALGVHSQLVGKWKKGATPTPENALKIADLIGVDFDTVVAPAVLHDLGYYGRREAGDGDDSARATAPMMGDTGTHTA